MFGTQDLALFLISGLLLNLTPGQDTSYILGRSIAQGRRAGILSVFGIEPLVFLREGLMFRYCTTAAALGAGWFGVLSLYVMGLTATAISFYVVIPYGLPCQYVMKSVLDAMES